MADDRRDDDPTGMRRVLSGMSDPHPMSENLLRRINESLDAERREHDQGLPVRFDPAVSTPPRRGRSRAVLVIGAAAATLGLATLGGLIHLSEPAADTRAMIGGFPRIDTPTPPVAGTGSPSLVGGASPVTGSDHPSDDTGARGGEVTIVSTGTQYERGRLQEQTDAMRTVEARTGAAPAVTDLTRDSIDRCLRRLSLSGLRTVVDVATFDGRSALVVVAARTPSSPGTEHTVAVVSPRCGDTDDPPLAGPIHLR